MFCNLENQSLELPYKSNNNNFKNMNSIKYIKFLFLLVLIVTGCNDKHITDIENTREEIKFSISIAKSAISDASLGVDERINTLDIYAYKMVIGSNNYRLHDKVSISGNDIQYDATTKKYSFSANIIPYEDGMVNLLFVANSETSDFSGRVDFLTTKPMTSYSTSDIFVPMSAMVFDLPSLTASTTLPSDIPLLRIQARVDIINSATNFTIKGASVWNTPDRGLILPRSLAINPSYTYVIFPSLPIKYDAMFNEVPNFVLLGDVNGTEATSPVRYELPEGSTDKSITGKLFVYENKRYNDGSLILSEKNLNDSRIIVWGTRDGETTLRYYRVDFQEFSYDNVTDSFIQVDAQGDVLRNYHYRITINSFTSDGFTTERAAAESTTINY